MDIGRLGGGRMKSLFCFALVKGKIDICAIAWASRVASNRILGDLEAEHGGHEAGGNLFKIFLSHPTRVQGLVATTLSVPKIA